MTNITPVSTPKTLTDLNRDWFDNAVEKGAFEIPWIKDLTKLISSSLRDNFDWLGAPKHEGGIKLLDYACGNGIVSMALSPFITQAIGIDLSPKMATAYNALSESQNLSKLFAIEGDLLSPSSTLQDPKFFDFDIIVMSMALHHVADTQLMINKLYERLAVGGVLVIVDWSTMGLAASGHGHKHGHVNGKNENGAEENLKAAAHTVAHWGFSVEEMTELFENTGMVDVGFLEGIEKSKVPAEMNHEQQMFIAKARKVGGH
ncbi:S-adenosyl-L-methionine-dependent methyltransferase [Stipitochalara longipes BDJ]|nr:S-adenosyl-L-methionine-dependent methyltransferase [Stipitochalara longipes BDJ]